MRRAAVAMSIAGAVALTAGVALIYGPAGLVVGGLLAIGAGMFLLPADRRRG